MLKLSIKARLRLAFLLLAGFFIGFGALSVDRMGVFNDSLVDMENRQLPKIVAVGDLAALSAHYRIAETLHVLTTDDVGMRRYEAELERLERRLAELQADYQKLIRRPEDNALFERYRVDYEAYLEVSRRALDLSRRNENEAAARELKSLETKFGEFNEDLMAMVKGTLAVTVREVRDANILFDQTRILLIALTVLVFLIAVVCMLYFERTVSRPLAGLTEVIRRLAAGDLTGTVTGTDRSDEIGQCARAVAAITAAIRGLTVDLRDLIDAARAGSLGVRADPSKQAGDYAVILAGANDLIEALTRPLKEVATIMQKLAAGDLKGRVTGAYEGDLRALKANLNRSLDALVGLFGELATTAAGLARSDLTKSLGGTYQGDFAAIKTDVNQALADLRETVGVLQSHAGQVAVASTETSAAAHQVAAGSARQLSTLVEVAGAVEQSAAAIGEVSANSERGRSLARSTAELAESGKTDLGRLGEIVEATAAFYGRMQQMTGKITRIADKTHVLALNAGIEAARAGQQGSGFGFVAQQIGRLAEEAAAAARDIETMIADVTGQSQRSVAVAADTRSSMVRIVAAAREADGSAQAIAAAITEQSSAAAALYRQIEDLRTVGESNAGAAEEISATMEELARMVHEMRTRLQRFAVA